MCGIVTFFGPRLLPVGSAAKYENALKTLVKINSLRGSDSTGVFAVDPAGDVYIHKTTVPGWQFPELKLATFDVSKYSILTYHNRAATIGDINVPCAHPFDFENIVGVHNGTLYSYKILHKDTWNSDSETMYAAFNTDGVPETLSKISGSVSIAYYDKRNKQLGIYHDDQRTLAYAITKDGAMFIASELNMILFSLARHDIEIEKSDELEINTLIKFNLDGEAVPASKTKIKKYTPPKNKGVYNNYNNTYSTVGNYKIGQKVCVEIIEVHKGTVRYIASGHMLQNDFEPVRMFDLSESEATIISNIIKDNGSFLMYGTVTSSITFNDSTKIIITPYKSIYKYAKKNVQEHIFKHMFPSADNNENNPVLLEDKSKKNNEILMSDEEFNKKTKNGCCICGHPISRNDDIDWKSLSEPAHKECSVYWYEEVIKKTTRGMH